MGLSSLLFKIGGTVNRLNVLFSGSSRRSVRYLRNRFAYGMFRRILK